MNARLSHEDARRLLIQAHLLDEQAWCLSRCTVVQPRGRTAHVLGPKLVLLEPDGQGAWGLESLEPLELPPAPLWTVVREPLVRVPELCGAASTLRGRMALWLRDELRDAGRAGDRARGLLAKADALYWGLVDRHEVLLRGRDADATQEGLVRLFEAVLRLRPDAGAEAWKAYLRRHVKRRAPVRVAVPLEDVEVVCPRGGVVERLVALEEAVGLGLVG